MLLNYLEQSYQVGFFTIHVYGAFLALGFLVGLWVARIQAREKGLNPDIIYELAVLLLLAGVVGARLFFIALNPGPFLSNPFSIFALHHGGLAVFGGLLGGSLAGLAYTRWRSLNFWSLADSLAPSLALGEAITRLGCDIYGFPAEAAPFARIVDGTAYHNIPLYSFTLTITIFLVLWKMRGRLEGGKLFTLYLLLYGSGRLFIDYFRGDYFLLEIFNITQVGSFGIIMLALLLFALRQKAAPSHK